MLTAVRVTVHLLQLVGLLTNIFMSAKSSFIFSIPFLLFPSLSEAFTFSQPLATAKVAESRCNR